MTTRSDSLANPRLWLGFVTMLLVSGIGNTFPVFFPSLLGEFGGSRAATASTVTLLWVFGAALGPVAGYLIARGDPRFVMSAGLGAVALGLGLGTLASTLPIFILSIGVGGGIGVGLTGMVTQAALISDAYVRRRGLALGIAFSGSMAAYTLAGPAQAAITALGWRGALAGYAMLVAALIPFALWIYPPRLLATSPPARSGPVSIERTVPEIVFSLPFWLLAILFCFAPFVGYLATIQHTLYLTARGFSREEASGLLAIGGVLSGSGRALAGWAADRLGAPAAAFLSFGMTLTGLLCLLGLEIWPGRLFAYGYLLFMFLPLGSRASIVPVLVSRIAPPIHYGVIFGYLAIGNNLGSASGPLLSGILYDRTGSYLVIYLCAIALVLTALGALTVFCRKTRARASVPAS
jgi:predicted MFS family arabinose efflux permease